MNVRYAPDGRMLVPELDCACGCEHTPVRQQIYLGAGISERIAEILDARNLGKSCVLVADDNTYPLLGKRVEELLTRDGYTVRVCFIHREGEAKPDERTVGEALLTMRDDTAFLISVGSGTLTDTARICARRCGLPFVAVATAPSMDGYTSSTAPLMLRGVKIHRVGVCPEIIVCDLNILRQAPLRMVRSGFGDVLGKHLAIADWRIGRLINGEPYCPTCAQIVLDAVAQLTDNAGEIASRSEKGMRVLTEGLLLAGLTALILGNTRAVASVEHNISFCWEMEQLALGRPAPMHGEAVGVATLLAWPIFTRFLQEDVQAVDVEAAVRARPSREERARRMRLSFGAQAAETIMRENPEDFLDDETHRARILNAKKYEREIKDALRALPPYAQAEDAMRRVGAFLTPAELGVSDEQAARSMREAKDYRSRYTLFKLIDELGLHERHMADYPDVPFSL